MSDKFTPGPWRSNEQFVGTMKSMASICECKNENGFFQKDKRSIANAKLIAAAPRMLAALIAAEKLCGSLTSDQCSDSIHIQIKDAIKKATGENK